MTSARRLFVGIMASATERAALKEYSNAWQWPEGARVTDPAKFHITLAFLGEVNAEQEREVAHRLASLSFRPFDVVLRKREDWSGTAVLVAEVTQPLLALHRQVAEATQHARAVLDRPFVPHVTLAYRAEGAHPSSRDPYFAMRVRQVSLIWSKGGVYEVLKRFPAS